MLKYCSCMANLISRSYVIVTQPLSALKLKKKPNEVIANLRNASVQNKLLKEEIYLTTLIN